MTSPMSNDELNRAIATELGMHPDVVRAHGHPLRRGDYPDWAHSIDAQKPVEKMLNSDGVRWMFDIRTWRGLDGDEVFEVRLICAEWPRDGFAPTIARSSKDEAWARAEALLAALQVKNGEK